MTTEADRARSEDPAAPADPVRCALRSLPREAAGEGFTEAVLDRLDRGPAERAGLLVRLPAWRLAAAAALAVLVLAPLAWNLAPAPDATPGDAPGPAREARLDALEAERARLVAELEALRRLAEEPVPVLYLGGDDEVELVLDLGTLARAEDPARPLPADYRPR